MKIIRAQVYINKKFNEDRGKYICDKIDKCIENTSIDYLCYFSNYNNKEVMLFDIYTQGNTFNECESLYQRMKNIIKNNTQEIPHQLAKIKAEKIL